jgi:hypothetical protein
MTLIPSGAFRHFRLQRFVLRLLEDEDNSIDFHHTLFLHQ